MAKLLSLITLRFAIGTAVKRHFQFGIPHFFPPPIHPLLTIPKKQKWKRERDGPSILSDQMFPKFRSPKSASTSSTPSSFYQTRRHPSDYHQDSRSGNTLPLQPLLRLWRVAEALSLPHPRCYWIRGSLSWLAEATAHTPTPLPKKQSTHSCSLRRPVLGVQ